jgi:cell division protein FtsI/penicillin-binding protein 2
MGDYAGMSGLEKTYESILMGQRGIKRFIRDNKSRIQLEVAVSTKTPGEVAEAHYRIEEATK